MRVQKLGDLEEPNTFSPSKQDFQLLVTDDDLLVLRVLEIRQNEKLKK